MRLNELTHQLGTFGIPSGRFSMMLFIRATLALVMIGCACPGMSQPAIPEAAWTHLSAAPPANQVNAARWVQPLRGELFRLNRSAMQRTLGNARRGEPATAKNIGTEIKLPMPDGTLARFSVVEAPVMAPELAANFPEIKTYAGQGIDDPSATARLDLTPQGFHAQVLSPRGAVYVDPAYREDPEHHVSYFHRDHPAMSEWRCHADRLGLTKNRGGGGAQDSADPQEIIQSGATLRTYRLAVAATGEYTAFHGGTVALGQAAIVSAINRINGVFETELAVRLILVANNNLLVFTNSATDPYNNADIAVMLGQNQSTLDSVIGSANYDLGHVFSTYGGGLALTPSVCETGYKAQGASGLSSPTGDSFWVEIVAHEMGHQFGANHTFNSETGFCGGGNRTPGTAFEPGSGSTIMAYAGSCFTDDLQSSTEPYFHGGSISEIQSTIASSGGCATNSSTGNTAPTVNAGADYTIPASTPFALTAVASDPNSDPLTFCWEEMDLGPATALSDADNGSSPLFRSFSPTNIPVRYFPKLSTVLANIASNQEKLPTTSRTMTFRVTVRDNRVGGGGVADDEMQVTVVSSAGPFVVTSPNTAVAWSGTRTVTWNVAGTASSPINASGVNILLSTNGGNSFTFLLATNVPNNGSAVVALPDLTSSQARIKVEGTGNIFYDVSDVDFSISSAGSLFELAGTALVSESCLPTNGVVDPYETVTVNWSLSNVGLTPTTNLVATLLTSNGVYYPSAPQNYGAIPPGGTVTRSFTFTPAGACGGSVTGVVQLADNAANLGSVSQVFALGPNQTLVSTQMFINPNVISIPTDGAATPYPSTISVSGVTNPGVNVAVTLNGVTHAYSEDIDVLLVGPNGQNVALMTYAGAGPINANLTFSDSAATPVPFEGTISSGTYLPTDYNGLNFPSPAPTRPYGTMLSSLTSTPNGTWSLYVFDTILDESGTISGGWQLAFMTSNSVVDCCLSFPAPTLAAAAVSNSTVHFNWDTMPGLNYQVQYRTNLALGAWQNFGSPIPGNGTSLGTNDFVAGGPMRFYRVLVSQ